MVKPIVLSHTRVTQNLSNAKIGLVIFFLFCVPCASIMYKSNNEFLFRILVYFFVLLVKILNSDVDAIF